MHLAMKKRRALLQTERPGQVTCFQSVTQKISESAAKLSENFTNAQTGAMLYAQQNAAITDNRRMAVSVHIKVQLEGAQAPKGEEEMKKFALVSLAIAAALAVSPAVMFGQTWDWSASSNGLVGSGTITATPDGSVAGAWDVTGMTGTFSNSNTSLGDPAFSGSVVSLTGINGEAATPSYNINSPSVDALTDYYDDLLYLHYTSPASNLDSTPTGGSGGGQLDSGGLVFNVLDPGNGEFEIQLQQISSANYAFIVTSSGGYSTQGYYGTLTTNFQVPDGGTTLVLLGLAVAGLAGLRRKLSA
jgi:hypothetical protein